MNHHHNYNTHKRSLRSMGVILKEDGFGTGYSVCPVGGTDHDAYFSGDLDDVYQRGLVMCRRLYQTVLNPVS